MNKDNHNSPFKNIYERPKPLHQQVNELLIRPFPKELEGESCHEYMDAWVIDHQEAMVKEFDIAPTTILSKAIEQVEKMGNYKVMIALVDLDKSKAKKECLYTFSDIESKKLREVIYKEMEKDFE